MTRDLPTVSALPKITALRIGTGFTLQSKLTNLKRGASARE